MNPDFRFSGVSEDDLKWRRIGGIAVMLSFAALIAGLAVTTEAQAPEPAAAAASLATAEAVSWDPPAGPWDGRSHPADCSTLPETTDCTYH